MGDSLSYLDNLLTIVIGRTDFNKQRPSELVNATEASPGGGVPDISLDGEVRRGPSYPDPV